MNRTYIKHEFLITSRSKRNLPFVLFIGVLLLSYCFIILPNKETKETFSEEEMSNYLADLDVEQKLREAKGTTGVVFHTGVPVYGNNDFYMRLYGAMLQAHEDGNFTRFLHLRAFSLDGNPSDYMQDTHLFKQSPFPGKDRMHLYYQMTMRYDDYLSNDYPITFGLMYEKTGLQALQKFLQENGIYIMLFCVIFFSSDILTRDRKYRTVLIGLPLSWYRQLNLKSFAAFMYSTLILLAILLIGVICMTLQYGFGYFDLHVPIMTAQQRFTLEEYDVISIGNFLAKTLIVVPLLSLLFIRLNVILSLLFKNEWIVLIVSSLILFLERFYFSRTTRELFGIDISYFPQTYFDIGNVLTGEKNFLVNIESITYTKGIVILLIAFVLIEILVFFMSKIVSKRQFYLLG